MLSGDIRSRIFAHFLLLTAYGPPESQRMWAGKTSGQTDRALSGWERQQHCRQHSGWVGPLRFAWFSLGILKNRTALQKQALRNHLCAFIVLVLCGTLLKSPQAVSIYDPDKTHGRLEDND